MESILAYFILISKCTGCHVSIGPETFTSVGHFFPEKLLNLTYTFFFVCALIFTNIPRIEERIRFFKPVILFIFNKLNSRKFFQD